MDSKSATLIFDLDGTLTDPRLGIVRSMNHALRAHGLPMVSDELIVAEIGPPLDETFRKFVPPGSAVVFDSLVATYRERYASVGFSENAIYPEIPQAVAELAGSGWRLGICTSKRRDFAEKILSLFGLLEHFTFVDGGDIGITKDAQLVRLLSGGVVGDDAVMIGDRAVDIAAARANRVGIHRRPLGFRWRRGDRGRKANPHGCHRRWPPPNRRCQEQVAHQTMFHATVR